jgi:flagellar biosynthesis protein FlhB
MKNIVVLLKKNTPDYHNDGDVVVNAAVVGLSPAVVPLLPRFKQIKRILCIREMYSLKSMESVWENVVSIIPVKPFNITKAVTMVVIERSSTIHRMHSNLTSSLKVNWVQFYNSNFWNCLNPFWLKNAVFCILIPDLHFHGENY